MNADVLLEKLDKVRSSGNGRWVACCPAHDDKSPSLQITQANDRVLIHCFAGCGGSEVLDSIGLDYSILYPEDDNYATRPSYKKPKPDEDMFVRIYKHDVRNGVTPPEEDTQRYRQILEKTYRGQQL
jgi:hypothetical protein